MSSASGANHESDNAAAKPMRSKFNQVEANGSSHNDSLEDSNSLFENVFPEIKLPENKPSSTFDYQMRLSNVEKDRGELLSIKESKVLSGW